MSFLTLLLGLSSVASAQMSARAPVPVMTSALAVVAQSGSLPTAAPLTPALAPLAPSLAPLTPMSPALLARPVVVAPAPLAAAPALRAISQSGVQSSPLWDGLASRPAAALGDAPSPVPAAAPSPPRRGLLKAAKAMIPLAGVTAALAVLDIGVVEGYLHPLHRAGVSWEDFQTTFMGMTVLKWWLYFIPVSVALLAGSGWLLARARGVLAAALLFLTGFEDILYYWLRASSLPKGLGWLDDNPFIAWSRLVTGTPSVTREGVLLTAALGMAAGLALLARSRRRA